MSLKKTFLFYYCVPHKYEVTSPFKSLPIICHFLDSNPLFLQFTPPRLGEVKIAFIIAQKETMY